MDSKYMESQRGPGESGTRLTEAVKQAVQLGQGAQERHLRGGIGAEA